MNLKNNKIIIIIIILAVISLTVGFSSLTSTLTLSDISAVFRIPKSIRVTDFTVTESTNSGVSRYNEYNYNKLSAGITLPNQDSTITYRIEVTNIGIFIGRIEDIIGLPENIHYELDGLGLLDDICDDNDVCRNGVVKDFFITFGYVEDGYDEDNNPSGEYNIDLTILFTENYRVNYIENAFYTVPRTQSGVTIDYNPETSILTLNGTATSSFHFMYSPEIEFSEGEVYNTYITYNSGSYTKTGGGTFVLDFRKLDHSSLTTRNCTDVSFPTSNNASITSSLVLAETSVGEASVLDAWLYIGSDSSIVFDNYQIKVVISKLDIETVTVDESYILPEYTPVRNNYTFTGWYTEETGGTQVTENTIFNETNDITLYAQYQDQDIVGAPTISYENNYITNGLEVLFDGRNNTGSGFNDSASSWKNIADNTNGTLHNNTWNDNNSLSFNGSSSYVSTTSAYHSENKTLEAIFSVNSIGNVQGIIGNAQVGGMWIVLETDGILKVQSYVSSSWQTCASSQPIEANTVYSLSGTYDGSNIKLYINGILDSKTSISGSISAPTSGTLFSLGCDPTAAGACSGSYLNGKVYSARSYNRALSYTEVRNNYAVDAIYMGNYTKKTPSVNITGATSTIGIKSYHYIINNGNYNTYNSSSKPQITTTGENTFKAKAMNLHGTFGSEKTDTIYVDNESPTATMSLRGSGATIYATLTVSDTGGSGIKNYGYSVQTSQTCNINSNYTTSSSKSFNTSLSSSGTYYLCARVTDNALNETYLVQKIESQYYPTKSGYYSYTVPYTGYYYIETWGGKGGGNYKGGYARGYTLLTANDTLYFYVGGAGSASNSTISNAGGYNGGGVGGNNSGANSYGGGGATDVRYFGSDVTPTSSDLAWNSTLGLNSRFIVAGGGGGGFYYSSNTSQNGIGGSGGGLNSSLGKGSYSNSNTTSSDVVSRALQTSGGVSNYGTGRDGSFGQAQQTATTSFGGGGGGGYYGGGTGYGKGGSGGSAFMSGYAGSNAITSSSSRTHKNNTKHYSNLYFINGLISANNNDDAGKARITYYGPYYQGNMPARTNDRLENVRYIKDCINGSDQTIANHWVEFQAIRNGVNLAKGKTVTGTSAEYNSSMAYSYITDGKIDNYTGSSNMGRSLDAGNQCVTIDLGQEYATIDEVAVWHYWSDGRTYNDPVTSVAGSDQVYRTIMNISSTESFNGRRTNAWRTDYDETDPTCTIVSSTNTLKRTSQTVSVSASDDSGVVSYYWGTTAPTSSTTYTSVTKTKNYTADLTANAAGTWYFSVKDGSDKTATCSIVYRSYKIINQLNTLSGTRTTYTSANYASTGTYTYIAKPNTVITLSDVVTNKIPTGSNTNRMKGISLGTASTTAATFLTGNDLIITLDSNKTYTAWWWRNIIYFYYRPNGGTLTTTTTSSDGTTTYTWSLDANNNIMRSVNGATAAYYRSSIQYGQTTMDLANYNYTNGLYITRSNHQGKSGAEWKCLSGCKTSGMTFNQNSISITTTNICTNIASQDCTIYLGVNWVQVATVRINGALGETITWSGQASGSTTLDNTGKKTGIKLTPGSYTFTAGTAFNNSFTNKYSRTYTVSASTTTINVYPNGSIYWFGNGSVSNSSLISKCGGAMYSWTDSGDGGSGTFTSISSKTWVGNDKNSMWARMNSSGGYYTALIRCKNTYKKGSYTRLRAMMKATGSTFDNVTTFLATNYSYTDGNDETGFSGNKYLNLDISSVSSSYGMHLYGHVRTKGGGEGSVRIYAIWLA